MAIRTARIWGADGAVPRRLAPLAVGAAACLAAALLTTACAPSREAEPSGEIQTVDVSPSPDRNLTTEEDERQRTAPDTRGGVLPGDFPTAWPGLPGATIVDLGHDAASGGWVLFFVPESSEEVAAGVAGRLRRSGWRVTPLSETALEAVHAGATLELAWREIPGGTELRVGYR